MKHAPAFAIASCFLLVCSTCVPPVLAMPAVAPASEFPRIDPAAPPLGLKTYADLELVTDEIIIAKPAAPTDATPVPSDAGHAAAGVPFVFPLFQKNALLRLIPDGGSLFAAYSKDGGANWSVPRFLLQDAAGRALSGIELRKLPGTTILLHFAAGGRRLQVFFRQSDLAKFATAADLRRAPPARFILESVPDTAGLSRRFTIGSDINFAQSDLPAGFVLDAPLGLLVPGGATGQIVHASKRKSIFEARVTFTPKGDLIVLFPDGDHASSPRQQVNRLYASRSTDGGLSWSAAASAYGDEEKHFAPLFARIAAEPGRLYAFEAVHNAETRALPKGRAFGFRTSDDDGRTWSPPQLIRRAEGNPNHNGVGVIQMAVTPADTFLMGFHAAKILRGALTQHGAREWTLVSPRRLTSPAPGDYAMNELRLISIGGPNVLAFARTQEGRIWKMRSSDDGKTFSDPEPTPLVHPDSPPMIFHLSDGKTLAALIHNRAVLRSVHEPCHSKEWTMPMPTPEKIALGNQCRNSYRDWVSRGELWISLSRDNGETWSEPRFLIANALAETLPATNPNYNLAYTDLLARDGRIRLIIPHRWNRVVYLAFPESALEHLPTKRRLASQYPAAK